MTGYCKIKIDEQEVGLRFAYLSVRWFNEYNETNPDASFAIHHSGEEGMTIIGIAKLIECAYKNDCVIKEVDPVLKFEDFYNWTEENDFNETGEIIRVIKVYTDSYMHKKLSEKKNQGSHPPEQSETTST